MIIMSTMNEGDVRKVRKVKRRKIKTIRLKLVSPEILEEDERPLLETRPFILGYIAKPLLLLVIGILFSATPLGPLLLIVAIPWLIYRLLKWRGVVYVVTNRRVIVKRGIVGLDYEDASLNKINNVFLRQGILGRLFGYGTISITTAGVAGMPFLQFESVRSPRMVLRLIKRLIS